MKYKKSALVGIFLGLVLVVSLFVFGFSKAPALGSAVVGNDYNSTEITFANSSSTAAVVVMAKGGSLGSIVIASSSPNGTFKVYDNAAATSSASSTRIAQFPSGATAGTYTFDRAVNLGIVLEVPVGFNGSYIVTWR